MSGFKVKFKKVKFKNLLSYGDEFQEYEFKNGIDVILGKNGNGKSTFISAVTFALYGKPFRKIKLDELVNHTTKKKLEVYLEFDVINGNDVKSYQIFRGIKPKKFKIMELKNGVYEEIDELHSVKEQQKYLEENIIKLSETNFRQLVVLGANLSISKDFMDLNQKEKENMFSIITDTEIFNLLDDVLKTDIKELTNEKQMLESEVFGINNNINSLQFSLNELLSQKEFIENQLEKIKESNLKRLQELNEKKAELFETLKEAKVVKEKFDSIEPKVQELSGLKSELEIKLSNNKSTFLSYKYKLDNKDEIKCPKCGESFCLNMTDEEIENIKKEMSNLKETLIADKNRLNEIKEELQQYETDFMNYKQQLMAFKYTKNELQSIINEIQRIESELSETKTYDSTKIEEISKNLEELKKEYSTKNEEVKKLNDRFEKYKKFRALLKNENLKSLVLKAQIPFMNKFINEFLDLFNTEFMFFIDENFDEKIVVKGSSDRSFSSLSNGQKQRITFAILFSFLKLIEKRNGTQMNILILDEYLDSSLDIEGIEVVLDILKTQFSDKNVILISHNENIKSKEEIISRKFIVKKDKFSKMILDEV